MEVELLREIVVAVVVEMVFVMLMELEWLLRRVACERERERDREQRCIVRNKKQEKPTINCLYI